MPNGSLPECTRGKGACRRKLPSKFSTNLLSSNQKENTVFLIVAHTYSSSSKESL